MFFSPIYMDGAQLENQHQPWWKIEPGAMSALRWCPTSLRSITVILLALSWRRRQQAPTKRWHLYSYYRVPYVIPQQTAVFINTDVKTSGFGCILVIEEAHQGKW